MESNIFSKIRNWKNVELKTLEVPESFLDDIAIENYYAWIVLNNDIPVSVELIENEIFQKTL